MSKRLTIDERIEKTKSVLKEELNSIRAGRANPSLLDRITVDYYGTETPLKNIANISAPEPRLLLIQPFDPSSIKEIEKAINESDLGINPTSDNKVIRLQVPQLTEERRRDLTKTVKRIGEDSKIAVRNVRREANEDLKKQEKAGEISEDELKRSLEEVQKTIEKAVEDIDNIVNLKEKEVMEV